MDSSVHVCCVLCCWMQFVFLSAVWIHVMSCAVWHAAYVFLWLRAFMLSCLVWTRDLWVFSLAAFSCLVLHMAGDLFCRSCACVFVLCEHVAFVLVFCVPCALMSIVLTSPILLSDYWFISSTSLSSSFAPFIISLCFQSCASSSLMLPCPALPCPALPCPALPCPALSCPVLSCPVLSCPALPCPALPCPALSCPVLSCPVLSCPALPCPALPCPVLSCPVLSCPVLSCPALPCPALPCPALPCPVLSCPVLPCPVLSCPALASCPVFPLRGSFSCRFVLLFSNKAHSPAQLSPRLILSPQPWHKKLKEWILHPMTPLK